MALMIVFMLLPAALSARTTRAWDYQQLLDGADLVVIATPTATKDTSERMILGDVAPDVHVIGVETEFDVQATLKGDKTAAKLVLHHYRFADERDMVALGAPFLAYFS